MEESQEQRELHCFWASPSQFSPLRFWVFFCLFHATEARAEAAHMFSTLLLVILMPMRTVELNIQFSSLKSEEKKVEHLKILLNLPTCLGINDNFECRLRVITAFAFLVCLEYSELRAPVFSRVDLRTICQVSSKVFGKQIWTYFCMDHFAFSCCVCCFPIGCDTDNISGGWKVAKQGTLDDSAGQGRKIGTVMGTAK